MSKAGWFTCQFEVAENERCGARFQADLRSHPKYCPDHRDEARRRNNAKNREKYSGTHYSKGVRPYDECVKHLAYRAAKECNDARRRARAREIIEEAGLLPTADLMEKVTARLDCEHCIIADLCPRRNNTLRFVA